MSITTKELRGEAASLISRVTDLRHELHAHPEIALSEHETRKRLVTWLSGEGVLKRCVVDAPRLGTDLVIEFPGRDREQVIGLRADMDALPVEEKTGLPYQSQFKGMMHACGHDGHMAVLAGTLVLLHRLGVLPPTSVRAIFQPGEEEVCAGAKLVEAGVCDGLSRVYALHGWPGMEAGMVSSKPGVMLAAADTFEIRCIGKAAHGATPEQGNNPLASAAKLVGRLLALHHRYARTQGAVITPCAVQGGQNTNTIPGTARILGTTRYLDAETGRAMKQEIADEAQRVSEMYSTACEITHRSLYHIPVINDPREMKRVRKTAEQVLGEGRFLEMPSHHMVAEDFAFYLDRVPGCMFKLGLGENRAKLHSDYFDFEDQALESGILMMSSLALGTV